MTLATARLAQIALNATDIARATAFYRDRLGLALLFEAPPSLSFFDCGGIRLMLTVPEEAEFRHRSSILYFRVDDIAGARRTLGEQGVRFRDEPHVVARVGGREIWMCFFEDSEGNVLALTEERAVG
jgi:catechol 2,3-dioxygenase-like lactoylglutathione lyase family enzyme